MDKSLKYSGKTLTVMDDKKSSNLEFANADADEEDSNGATIMARKKCAAKRDGQISAQ